MGCSSNMEDRDKRKTDFILVEIIGLFFNIFGFCHQEVIFCEPV